MNANAPVAAGLAESTTPVQKGPTARRRLRSLWKAEFLSPKDLVRRAIVVSLLFLIAQIFGFKEFTSVLNGTTGSLAIGWTGSAAIGLLYIVLYLAFVLLVPILLLAAATLTIWKRFGTPQSHESPSHRK